MENSVPRWQRERDLEFGSLLVCKMRPRISEGHLLLVNLTRDNRNKRAGGVRSEVGVTQQLSYPSHSSSLKGDSVRRLPV